MNAKLESFINQKKEELKETELKQKEEHLVSIGLIDKYIEDIIYIDEWDATKDCVWDATKQMYYKKIQRPIPIQVTDEEYQELLKYVPIRQDTNNSKNKDNVDKVSEYSITIKTISNILFVLNLIIGIIGLIMLINSDDFIEGITSAIILVYALFGALYTPIISGFANIVAFAEKSINFK